MKLRYIFSTLAAMLLLGACEEEKYGPIDENTVTGVAELFATLGEAEEVQTRAAVTAYQTYTAFTEGDRIGLFATGSLRRYNHATDQAKDAALLPEAINIPFEMYETSTNIRWGDNTGKAILKWDTKTDTNTEGGKAADIYAYFPYQDGYNNGNYDIFNNVNEEKDEGQLADVLVAQRTTVENNNPAIFLTFKHRFSLLHLTLGTGMAAVTGTDDIFAITTEGIASDAAIRMEDYVVQLEKGDIKNFKAIEHNDEYYIILPAGTVAGGTNDSLKVKQIKIGGDASDLGESITMQPSMIYHMTMHKHEGSIAFENNGIEVWGGNSDLGGIREEPGIYWASDMRNLIIQYNNNPSKDNLSLQAYGTWDESNNRWVFNLMRNIDMNDITWDDQSFKSFYGIFNGNGYSITGFDITDGYGLFDAVLSGSQISDLTLVNISIKDNEGSAGALAGTVDGGVTIHNCHVTGNSVVNGGGSTGGLIGYSSGTITRCSSAAEVNASGGGVGGLVGISSGSLEGSYATGRVTATGSDVGGLVGSGSTIKNCYAAGSVTGEDNVGGLAGTAGNVDNCYAVGDINGEQNVGGLIGASSGDVKDSSSGGTVTGKGIVGGLIGNASSTITLSFSTSNVTAEESKVGGLVGELASGSIDESYATGDVTAGGSMVGGLAGYAKYEITNSYAICNVTGNDYVGGLVGQTIANVGNCKAEGDIKGGDNVGGLIGESSGSIHNSSSGGTVTGNGLIGGLIGSAFGSITLCTSTSDVTAEGSMVGGLAGVVGMIEQTTFNVDNCKAEGDIKGGDNVGGLIGQTSGNVSNSSSSGTVTGQNIVGGLIGALPKESSIVSYSYSRSEVSATSNSGGLIGLTPNAETESVTTYETITDPDNPDNEIQVPVSTTIEYREGAKITYSYATNSLPLIGSGGWIEYSYDTGKVTVKEEMGSYYYSIDLLSIDEEGLYINAILTGLNSKDNTSPAWEIGTVIIGGEDYSLPILTSNK